MIRIIFSVYLLLLFTNLSSQNIGYQIGLLKYNGGGDWYSNLETSLPNLIRFCNQTQGTSISEDQAIVEVGSSDIFNYPFIHMTGHGNVIFSDQEAQNLRNYLIGGGFLHIDDNYGLDRFIRKELKKVFPQLDLVELPSDHNIYRVPYYFPDGLPKIHEHDGAPSKGYGLIYEGRLVCYYTVESDLGDGWEDPEIHEDSEETRLKALKMGVNILLCAFTSDSAIIEN